MTDLKRPESVLVVVYSDCGQVLMLQREDDPDFWQSVTGTMEADEAPVQTAYREIAEEIGVILPATAGRIFDCRCINQFAIREQWLYRCPKDTFFNTEYVFSLSISIDTEITLTEHLQYRWVSKQDAVVLAWSDSNRDAIKKFVPEAT